MPYSSALFKPSTDISGHLVPADSIGLVDVIQDYFWTISPQLAREDVPVMELTEYQIQGGQLRASWDYWLKQYVGVGQDLTTDLGNFGANQNNKLGSGVQAAAQLAGDVLFGDDRASSPYEALYQAIPTGFTYRMPYFSDYNQSANNSWDTASNTIDAAINDVITNTQNVGRYNFRYGLGSQNTRGKFAARILQAGAGAFKSTVFKLPSIAYPSVKTESPQSWTGTASQPYSVTFDLINTIEYEAIRANWELIYLLTHQNISYRRNALISYPPCIYEVSVPGIRFCPAAYLNVNVVNVGQTRMVEIDEYGLKSIPEAYRITISINELLQYTRNIHGDLLENNSTITAIAKPNRDDPGVIERGTGILDRLGNTLNPITDNTPSEPQ